MRSSDLPTGPSTSRLVNVQFGDPNSIQPKTGLAASGHSANDYWNQLTFDFKGGDPPPDCPPAATVNCLDSAGNQTSMQVNLYTCDPLAGSAGNFAVDPMLNGFLSSGGGGNWQLYVYLPRGHYDVYLYSAYPYGAGILGSTFEIGGTIQSTTTGSYDINSYSLGNQYIVYQDIPGPQIIINVSSPVQPFANGMQIYLNPFR